MYTMEIAKKKLHESPTTCIIVKENDIMQSEEHGIRPLMKILNTNPLFLKDAFVADKIVGKAAAMLMIYGNVREVYAEIISEPAIQIFNEYSIPFQYSHKEPYIQNREHNGMCPMEQKALACLTPNEAFTLFKTIIPVK